MLYSLKKSKCYIPCEKILITGHEEFCLKDDHYSKLYTIFENKIQNIRHPTMIKDLKMMKHVYQRYSFRIVLILFYGQDVGLVDLLA